MGDAPKPSEDGVKHCAVGHARGIRTRAVPHRGSPHDGTLSPSRVTTMKDSMSATTRVAIYARVSTLHGQNPEMQVDELREYALRRGWTIVDS